MTDTDAPPTILIANPGADLYGSDRMVLETVSALVEDQFRVVVAVPHPGPLVAEVEGRGGTVVVCPTPILRKAALHPRGMLQLIADTLASLPPSLRLLRRLRPAAVLVNTITPPLWFPLASLFRIPVIGHVHEAEVGRTVVVQRALYAPLHLAQTIIVNSQFAEKTILQFAPRLGRKSRVVYNGVPGPEEIVSPRSTLASPLRLLFMGRLSPRKGPDVAIKALTELRERGITAHLDLVGEVVSGHEWFREELHQLVADRDLDELVTFHGFQADVWPFLAAADLALVPSTVAEPFGNVAVEALRAARPVVASDIGGLPEACFGAETAKIIPAGSPELLADAVQELTADWSTTAAAALRDATAVGARYSLQRYRSQLQQVVRTLIEEAPSPASPTFRELRSSPPRPVRAE